MGDSKPTEILSEMQSLTSLNYERDSLSAYVSAESSPSQIDERLTDEPCFPKSDTSSSINTYWGLPPASSLLIDEEDKQDALNHSRDKMSQSKSFHDSKNIAKLSDDKEYQSLPLEKTLPLDNNTVDKLVTVKETTSELKKELSESDLFKLNVVEGEEDLVNVDLKENASIKTDQLPEMSVPRSKSSTMAFIESIFSSSSTSTKQTEVVETKEVVVAPVKEVEVAVKEIITVHETKHTLTAALSTAATSASSPNPECSPYKFLMNEYAAKPVETKIVSSLSLGTEQQQAAQVSTKADSVVVDEKIMEDLASLNRKESEKHDPILSGANSSKKATEAKSTIPKGTKPEKKASPNKPKTASVPKASTRSPSKSTSSLALSTENPSSTKVDHVPASSREFCMNLNFNLASAAAAKAGGPIVVVDNTSKTTPVAKENDKFTSNASTSSIHNDLKMILEESKDVKKLNKAEKKLNKSTDVSKKDKPKPQRVKKDSKNTSKNNLSNASFNSSTAETTTNSMTVETGNLSPTSKTNNLNLIKMMMLMVDNNGKNKEENTIKKHKQHMRSDEEPSLIELAKQNGRYKYNKEFLMQIREQRAAFIDQIHPDIFKAYCYCMNGKYWDPEKYFDIVQFPGEYDRIKSNRSNNNYNRSQSYNNNNNKVNTNNKYNKKNTPNGTFNNSQQYNNKNMSVGTTPTAVPNYMNDDSPQPLQVPKNSPKFTDNHNKSKESSVHSIFESLGLSGGDHQSENKSKLDADKILLGLIKKDQQTTKNTNLMDILNKKQNIQKSHQSPNILDNLLPKFPEQSKAKEVAKANKHYPMILTAQELEMSQMNQEKLSKCKLPNEISMAKLEDLQQSMESNDSFAYKQLVKNLSNHPLTNSNTTLNNKLEASLAKLQSKTKSERQEKRDASKPSWQVSNDGTNMLKQLLNLKTNVKQSKPRKQHHHKSNKSPHLSMSNGSNSGASSAESSPVESSMKFPSVNPHEKPFETYMAEENRKQIEHVVASALSQVLSKSPNSVRQLSPAPKSPIQDLIEKINIQHSEQDMKNTQHEHFNSLLNKMSTQQANLKQGHATNESDILKWFSDAKLPTSRSHNQMSAQSLSEIEFMQMHRPASALSKLF